MAGASLLFCCVRRLSGGNNRLSVLKRNKKSAAKVLLISEYLVGILPTFIHHP